MSVLRLIYVLFLPIFCFGQEIIIEETFEYSDGDLPANWWSEGCPGEIKDGRLFVDADTTSYGVSTIWFDKEFGGDFSIEFDVCVISSKRKANNINCFLLYSDPNGKHLKESSSQRSDGAYKKYHKLNGYIFTYLANGSEDNARFRFRYNPDFQLLQENFGYECRIGKTYNIKILKVKNNFQYWIDSIRMIDFNIEDNNRHTKGLFGFRTWRTTLWWDNLIIKQL